MPEHLLANMPKQRLLLLDECSKQLTTLQLRLMSIIKKEVWVVQRLHS
jgi:hypothetical protein